MQANWDLGKITVPNVKKRGKDISVRKTNKITLKQEGRERRRGKKNINHGRKRQQNVRQAAGTYGAERL